MDTDDRMVADQVMGMDNQNIYHNLTVERFAHSMLPENKTKIRDDKVLPGNSYLDFYHKTMYYVSIFGYNEFFMQILLSSELVWL